MKGIIKQRSKGAYTIWLELPREGARRRREVFTVHGSRKEAERRLHKRILEIEAGEIATGSHTTVAEFLREAWLPAVRRNKTMAASTKQRYAEIVERFLIPVLGHEKITKVTALKIDAAVAAWENMKHAKTSEPLSQRTVHHAFATLRTALNYAERKDIITRNLCAKAETVSLGSRTVTHLDRAGLIGMLGKLRGDRLEIPAIVAAFCGLRRGELLALHWSDIDLEHGTLHVERSLELLDVHRTDSKSRKRPRVSASFHSAVFHAGAQASPRRAMRAHHAQSQRVRRSRSCVSLGGWFAVASEAVLIGVFAADEVTEGARNVSRLAPHLLDDA